MRRRKQLLQHLKKANKAKELAQLKREEPKQKNHTPWKTLVKRA